MVTIPPLRITKIVNATTFAGFIAGMVIVFLTNVPIKWGDFSDGAFKFLLYFVGMGLLVIVAVDRPGLKDFIQKLWAGVMDPNLTIVEKDALNRLNLSQWLGFTADISQLAHQEEKLNAEKTELINSLPGDDEL